jgi:predicted glycoside hydrolase/deacetylase ChbG (UPF0249 family)
MVVASIKFDQVFAHFSGQKGSQIVKQLVTFLFLRSDDFFDCHHHFHVLILVNGFSHSSSSSFSNDGIEYLP